MKSYNLTPPKKKDFCIPSCFQAILRRNGYETSQKNIADVLIKKQNGFLPEGENLKKFLKQKGLSYEFYWYNQTPFNEPDSLLMFNPDKDILLGINDHCFLYLNHLRQKIMLLDPNDSLIKQKDYYQIIRNMHETKSGLFGLISKI